MRTARARPSRVAPAAGRGYRSGPWCLIAAALVAEVLRAQSPHPPLHRSGNAAADHDQS